MLRIQRNRCSMKPLRNHLLAKQKRNVPNQQPNKVSVFQFGLLLTLWAISLEHQLSGFPYTRSTSNLKARSSFSPSSSPNRSAKAFSPRRDNYSDWSFIMDTSGDTTITVDRSVFQVSFTTRGSSWKIKLFQSGESQTRPSFLPPIVSKVFPLL